MIVAGFEKYCYVLEVNEDQLSFHGREGSIFGSLKRGGGIARPEWHSCKFEKAMMACEHGLLAVQLVGINLLGPKVFSERRTGGCLPQKVTTLVHIR